MSVVLLYPPSLGLHFFIFPPVINNALLCSVLHLFPVVTSALLNKLWITPVQPAAYLLFHLSVKLLLFFRVCLFLCHTRAQPTHTCTHTHTWGFQFYKGGIFSCKLGCFTQISRWVFYEIKSTQQRESSRQTCKIIRRSNSKKLRWMVIRHEVFKGLIW